ncbi:hypothetical protein QTG54_006778 [Skeletonema marinoi]|uniref:Uncharacterized protein n=1 Tax=Skeletonema marinoi TaxID=267567 RepID=A0AAD9DDZ6_9STRA|nr:hypothetical protein QTG54_006778 [Skeletonema marinoi]
MTKSKLSIRRTGEGETPDAFTTPPILPPAETTSANYFATSYGEEDTDDKDTVSVSVAPPAFPFPNLTAPSTPQTNFSSVPFGVQAQLRQLNLRDGDDGSDAATPILGERAVPFKPLPLKSSGSPVDYPNTRHEETNTSFKSIDSFFGDLTLTPIMEDSWIIDLPPRRHTRPARRSGSPYLQPRKARLFDEPERHNM